MWGKWKRSITGGAAVGRVNAVMVKLNRLLVVLTSLQMAVVIFVLQISIHTVRGSCFVAIVRKGKSIKFNLPTNAA